MLKRGIVVSTILHLAAMMTVVHLRGPNEIHSIHGPTLALDIIGEPTKAQKQPTQLSSAQSVQKPSTQNQPLPADQNSNEHSPTSVTDTPGNGSHTQYNQELAAYVNSIRMVVASKKVYPPTSMRLNEKGQVRLEVTVRQDGTIDAVSIKEQCPFHRLNSAAIALIEGIEKFEPFPSALAHEQTLKIDLPIDYVLNN